MTRRIIVLFSVSFIALLLFINCNFPESSDRQITINQVNQSIDDVDRNNFNGTYRYGTDLEHEPVGSLTLYQTSDSSAIFYLDVCRGAPSYNLGQLLGDLKIDGNEGTYNGDCTLHFTFQKDQLIIRTDTAMSECGFGFAVFADHNYSLIDKTIPKYFIDGQGDTTHFEGLSVQNYYDSK